MIQFRHTVEMLHEKCVFQFEILHVKVRHVICLIENNNSASKWAYEWVFVFHYVNSVLYTVTNIHPKARILLKAINVFSSENFALFMVTGIHCN